MYLSRMRLDLSLRKTMMALASPKLLHGAVEDSFPQRAPFDPNDHEARRRMRKLWRIDRLGGNCYLLLLSEEKPDMTAAVRELGISEEAWETKDISPLLARVTDGSEWHFRLTANPTIRKTARDKSQRGELHAHITVGHQKDWLAKRAEKHGFKLGADTFDVVHSRWLRFRKASTGTAIVTLLSVTYEGILQVTDAERFRSALTGGIGRGKAYGMGLITIIPRPTA